MAVKTHIFIHHSLTKDSGTVSWDAIKNYHINVNKWRDIGYHFGIEKIGDTLHILTGRMITEDAAAVKERGANRYGIHICVVGNFDLAPPDKNTLLILSRLVGSYMELLNIPKGNVLGHKDYAPYKSCPGTKFDMDAFRRML
jgi:N-acetylmuramoyl-L-alanine amidase